MMDFNTPFSMYYVNQDSDRMNIRILLPFVTLIIGMVIGFFARDTYTKSHKAKDRYGYIERHEGQFKHVNPLLGCDVAEDVLTDPDLGNFKSKVEAVVKNSLDKQMAKSVGVYFRELNDGYWFSVGEMNMFTPASLRKVPLMIALLKQSESDAGMLDRFVRFDLANDYNQSQNIKPSKTLVFGNRYTVRDLIYRMIAYSDNNAFTYLAKIVNPASLDLVYSSLRMQNPRSMKDDEFFSVQTYASFFRVLYNSSYLSREHSDWALELLAKSEFVAGIVAGVPQGVEVAHKFGEKSDGNEGTVQLHDCGIVYYPKHPYLLCVMSKGTRFEPLDDIIKDVSAIIFTEVDAQSRGR